MAPRRELRRESMEMDQLLPRANYGTDSIHASQRNNKLTYYGWRIVKSRFFMIGISIVILLVFWFDSKSSRVSTKDSPFIVRFADHLHAKPVTGRLMICISKKNATDKEPRYLINDSLDSQQVFGTDVHEWHPMQSMTVNKKNAVGYPRLSLSEIPEGEYWVQAVLNSYVLYNRSDNMNLWLPAFHTFESDNGVLTSPGTLYSKPKLVHFSRSETTEFVIDQITPPQEELKDTEMLRHVKFRSPRLSEFWGTDVFLKAWVLLPFGFDQHPEVKYPLFIYHTHYKRQFEFYFNPELPKNGSEVTSSVDELYGHYLYRNWTGNDFVGKRGLIVQLQHANPYYDDSYAVNSKNIGPYGDAITYEFIPYIEKLYRGIGEGWARTLYGGSTGGWESFAVQVFYPDQYNGCWSFCPDALDFRSVQLVNVLEDKNAYYTLGAWTRNQIGSKRDYLGKIIETMDEENHHELAMGSHGRSGGQWDAWQAVYGPQDNATGYPALIWDKLTGEINHTVSQYWREHYDMRVKLEREWPVIGSKLIHKLRVFVGVMDSYYLNDAAYLMEKFLKQTTPYYNGSIEFGVSDGRGYEHCWTGSFDETLSLAWNTLNQRVIPDMIQHLLHTAPEGADLSFTTY